MCTSINSHARQVRVTPTDCVIIWNYAGLVRNYLELRRPVTNVNMSQDCQKAH